jgi:hypothetical protein
MKLAYNVYLLHLKYIICKSFLARGHHGRNRMVHVVGFTTTYVSSTNKTDCHNITEILLKVLLKHHKPKPD